MGFGSTAAATTTGSRQVAYQKTADTDSSGVSGTKNGYLNSICAMPQYQNKQPEEIRWEDYQAGVKGGTGAPPQQAAATAFGSGGFGASPSSPFGGTAAAAPAFGSGGAFGAPKPAFGAPSSPAFGSTTFGSATPAFGSTPAAPAFGSSPATGGLFGAANTASSPFGTGSSPAFGANKSLGGTATFGGAANTPAFGGTTSPAFGAGGFGTSTFGATPATSTGFGGVSSTPAFGATPASTPAFGSTPTPSLFGGGATSTPGAFGGTTPAFSFATSTPAPAFGSATAPFGSAAPAATPGTGIFSQPTSGNLFGSTAFSTGGGFGAKSTAFPAQTPGAATTNMFGGLSAPALSPPPGQTPALVLPGVATSPYGSLPAAPVVAPALPEYKVGISQRPLGPLVGRGVARPTALLTPRSVTPRVGIKLRAPRPRSLKPTDDSMNGRENSVSVSGIPIANTLPDPRYLVARDALPSTEAAASVSRAPSRGATHQSHTNGQRSAQLGDAGSPPIGATDGHGSDDEPPVHIGHEGSGSPEGSPSPRYEQGSSHRGQHRGRHGGIPVTPATGRSRSYRLADDEISDLLPQLDSKSDLVLSPSLRQLAVMAADDPSSLANVANFTISRPNIGAVRWLEEVDVTSADVEALVRLTKGGVEVYLDDATKPPVGQGFNRPARITLCNVFKMEPATKRPTRDPEAIARFTTRLKQTSAQQGATFVSYNPETGDWKFEVEHFSRYGLLDDDDDGDDDIKVLPKSMPVDSSGAAASLSSGPNAGDLAIIPVGKGGVSDEAGAADSPAVEEGVRRGLTKAMGRAMVQSRTSFLRGVASARPLPAALPAALSLNPGRLAAMRDCFQDDQAEQEVSPNHTERVNIPTAAPTAWLPQKAAITGPSTSASWSNRGPPRSLTPTPTTAPPPLDSSTTGGAPAVASPAVLDLGQVLGSSTRSSWAPGSVIACMNGGGETQRVVLRRVAAACTADSRQSVSQTASQTASLSSAAVKRRVHSLLRQSLEIHAAHSVMICPTADEEETEEPAADGAEAQMPLWQLKCARDEELRGLCLKYTAMCTSSIMKHGLCGSDRSCLQQEGWTWDLARLLFEAIPGEAHAEGALLGGDSAEATGAARIASFQRRAALSHWLQDGLQSEVAARLVAGASGVSAVAACIIGHQLPAAAALAAACGDVRLATLLTQAGNRSRGTEDIATQLATWANCNITPHINEQRLLVYTILAGHVDSSLESQPDIPWRAALGMHLWYAFGGTATISCAVDAYEASVVGGYSAAPLTPHRQRPHASISSKASSSDEGSPEDVDLQLLRLYVSQSSSSPKQPPAFTAGGTSPDPLDARLAWVLTTVLAAVGALPPAVANSSQAAAVGLTLIEQLEATGGLEEWAVYVALHLQDSHQRSRVTTELLSRHAPAFAGNPDKQAFLLQRLCIPREAVAASLAMYEGHCGQIHRQLGHLVQGGPAALAAARHLAAHYVAPQLLLANRMADLESLLKDLCCGRGDLAGALAPYAHLLHLQAADREGDQQTAQYHAVALSRCLASSAPPLESGTRAQAALAAAGLSKVAEALSHWSLCLENDGRADHVVRQQQSAVANDLQLLASMTAVA